MDTEDKNWAILRARFSHGTAQQVSIPSVVPVDKQAKEKFWVEALVSQLSEYQGHSISIEANLDDSSGGHDVILRVDENEIGIQVTELTSELTRRREHIRQKYLYELFNIIKNRSISTNQKIMVSVFFADIDSEKLLIAKPDQLAEIIVTKINDENRMIAAPFEHGSIVIQPLTEGTFYVPSLGNIGIDINIDQLPISFETISRAIDYLSEKKKKSKSPWLLIWSLDFWIIKADYGSQILSYLQTAFSTSNFEKVFFIESLGGEGLFEANLSLHPIKA
jgi:hypothetical protein